MTENTKQDVPMKNQLEVFTEPIKYVTTGVVIDSHAIKVSRPIASERRFSEHQIRQNCASHLDMFSDIKFY